jgi:hypothetical protein
MRPKKTSEFLNLSKISPEVSAKREMILDQFTDQFDQTKFGMPTQDQMRNYFIKQTCPNSLTGKRNIEPVELLDMVTRLGMQHGYEPSAARKRMARQAQREAEKFYDEIGL